MTSNFELAGYSDRAASVKAEMAKQREEALSAAIKAGASAEEQLEINDKYVTIANMRVARVEREEEQARQEAERRKKVQEDYNNAVKSARAAYESDLKRVDKVRDFIDGAFARGEESIQKSYEQSVAMAQGPALKGQNDFTGGSVEEFKFISAMMSQDKEDSAVEQAEQLAQDQRERLAEMKKQSDQQIEDKLQELRGGLESKLEALISAINSKE